MAIVLTPNNIGKTLETSTDPHKFNVKVDGSSIKSQVDGTLFVEFPPNPVGPVAVDAPTEIALSGDGTLANPLSANIVISGDAWNTVTIGSDGGLHVPLENSVGSVTVHPDGDKIVVAYSHGAVHSLGFSAFLKTVDTDDSGTVSFSGTGTSSDPLIASTNLSTDVNNIVALGTDGGLYAPQATKSSVGLGNVDNTSDVGKPVSTAQAAALATKADGPTQVHSFLLMGA